MPITSSAKKALRQSRTRRNSNIIWKEKLKKAIRVIDKSPTALSQAYKIIDKSAKVGIIKRNKAARMKSKLSKLK